MEEIRKIPPVTRFLLFATGLVTLPCILQIIPVTHFVLFWPFVTRKWHFWRLITAFFYGGSGLPLLFDLFLLYRNSSELELNTFFRRTSEYAWALILIGATIIGINYPLRSAVLFNPMLNALTYLWARANPNAKVSFFGMITVPAPYLPYAYLALDLIRGGPPLAIQSATGLVSAHCYYFLKDVLPAASGGGSGGRPRPFLSTLVQPPIFLQKLLPDSQDPALEGQRPLTGNGGTSRTTGFGTAYAPAGRSFGDNGASNLRGGNTLGSSSSSGGSWIPSFLRGGNNKKSNSSSSNSNNEGLNRNALLEATERRLREQRNNSIAGRNQNSNLNKSSSSSSSTSVPTSLAGSGSLSSDSKTSSITSRQGGMVGNEPTRRTNPSSSGQGGMLTFGQFAKKNDDKGKGKEEDHSSSGGSVAEQRRGNPNGGDDERGKGKGKEKESIGYQWGGGGNRLGD